MRPEEEEDDCVEEERVEGAPERVGHGLEDDPADDHVVGVEDGAVRHDKAREAARVAAEHHAGVLLESSRGISSASLHPRHVLLSVRQVPCCLFVAHHINHIADFEVDKSGGANAGSLLPCGRGLGFSLTAPRAASHDLASAI